MNKTDEVTATTELSPSITPLLRSRSVVPSHNSFRSDKTQNGFNRVATSLTYCKTSVSTNLTCLKLNQLVEHSTKPARIETRRAKENALPCLYVTLQPTQADWGKQKQQTRHINNTSTPFWIVKTWLKGYYLLTISLLTPVRSHIYHSVWTHCHMWRRASIVSQKVK